MPVLRSGPRCLCVNDVLRCVLLRLETNILYVGQATASGADERKAPKREACAVYIQCAHHEYSHDRSGTVPRWPLHPRP